MGAESGQPCIDPVRGILLGGLFFIAFMKNPSQFITLQQRLGTHDALNEYIKHTGSAIFACPGGWQPGQHWGTSSSPEGTDEFGTASSS